jgi:hypothetical protein
VLLEDRKSLAKTRRRRCEHAVEPELVSDTANGPARLVLTDRGSEVVLGQPHGDPGLERTQVKYIGDCDITDQKPTRCHHVAGHTLIGERVYEMAIRLDRDRCAGSAEVQHRVPAGGSPPPSTVAASQVAAVQAGVAFETAFDRDTRGRSDGECELPMHLGGSDLQPVDSINDGLELTLDQEVDGSLTVEFGVAGVEPDLDALGAVHLLELTNDVVDIDEAVPCLPAWS